MNKKVLNVILGLVQAVVFMLFGVLYFEPLHFMTSLCVAAIFAILVHEHIYMDEIYGYQS